jgi:hypothetical protein
MEKIYRLACEFCLFVISTSGEQKGRSEGKIEKGRGLWGEGGIQKETIYVVQRGDEEKT